MSQTINVSYLLQTLDEEDVRDVIREALQEGPCEILFTKVSGEVRLMKCTLDETEIPDSKKPVGEMIETEDMKKVLRVFDTELGEWRSFRVANVKSVRQL